MKNDHKKAHWLLLFQSYFLELVRIVSQKLIRNDKDIDKINKTFLDLQNQSHDIYIELVKKYPDFIWAEKYVDAGLGCSVHPITSIFMLQTKGIHSLLSDEATLNDIVILLYMGIPVTADIITHQGTPHTIEILSFSNKRKELYFKDPLGNYNKNYRIIAHSYCYISYDDFVTVSIGSPCSITIMMTDKKSLLFIKDKMFKTKKYYIF